MHLPDGFLNNQISVGLIAVATGFLISALIRLKKSLSEKIFVAKGRLVLADGPTIESTLSQRSVLTKRGQDKIQLMAVLGALIFALQMINFPITNGTSGHLIGGVLAAVILGPWAGLIVMSTVLVVQSIIFADGGVLALGANILNMGLVASLGGYYLYLFLKSIKLPKFIAIAITAWLIVVIASFFCALEIGWSGTIDFALVIPAMIKVHLLIGIGEAILTVVIIKALKLKLHED